MSALRLQLGPHEAGLRESLGRLVHAGIGRRLLAHDDRIWGDDPAHRKVAANRLGWLDSPAAMLADAPGLAAFANEVKAEGFTHAVLLGMGGSSLAPEVLRLTFGVAPGGLELTILDNTSPAAVQAVADGHDLAHTLFVVASKSGGTIEVVSFERFFWERVRAVRGDSAGRAFVAITDPGTSLAALAERRGYRRTFINPADIGGRYSALSRFGLVPAALLGIDVAALLESAVGERAALATDSGPGLELGAALGSLALAGRDKLTLVLPPALASYGTWIEQLVAESTGKSGKGILPVIEERVGEPSQYGSDRVFVAIGVPELPAATAASLDALAAAGHPVVRWSLPRLESLGADMLRWEIATAVSAAVIGVDPFDEPDVSAAKAATQRVLDLTQSSGRFPAAAAAATAAGLQVFVPEGQRSPGDSPAAWVETLASWLRPSDYLAMLAYVHRTEPRHDRLQALRHAMRDRTGAATTLGYGPRFLHSTGQLHKGGPPTGVFLQLTADEGDVAIPESPFSFAVLRAAQAAGDFDVLAERGRRVMRIHLGTDVDAGLAELARALAAVPR